MMKGNLTMKRIVLLSAGLLGGVLCARAADVGDQIFPVDLNDMSRAEVIYEHQDRDTNLKIGDGGSQKQTLNANLFMARLHTDVGENASLDFDVGGVDPSGGDFGFYGGLGIRMLAYDADVLRVSAEAQGHIAPSLSGTVGGVQSDYHEWNADAGVMVGAKLPLADNVKFMPYVGPTLSLDRLDGHTTTGSDEKIHATEKSPVGGAAGIALLMPGNSSFRIEGRYYGGTPEISIGAGIAF
jgi:opacity protein-like surface antigen